MKYLTHQYLYTPGWVWPQVVSETFFFPLTALACAFDPERNNEKLCFQLYYDGLSENHRVKEFSLWDQKLTDIRRSVSVRITFPYRVIGN